MRRCSRERAAETDESGTTRRHDPRPLPARPRPRRSAWSTVRLPGLSSPSRGSRRSSARSSAPFVPDAAGAPATPADIGLDYEAVRFTTDDGVTLSGWLIPAARETRTAVIVLHGFSGNRLPSWRPSCRGSTSATTSSSSTSAATAESDAGASSRSARTSGATSPRPFDFLRSPRAGTDRAVRRSAWVPPSRSCAAPDLPVAAVVADCRLRRAASPGRATACARSATRSRHRLSRDRGRRRRANRASRLPDPIRSVAASRAAGAAAHRAEGGPAHQLAPGPAPATRRRESRRSCWSSRAPRTPRRTGVEPGGISAPRPGLPATVISADEPGPSVHGITARCADILSHVPVRWVRAWLPRRSWSSTTT